jgi:hypothetical protein
VTHTRIKKYQISGKLTFLFLPFETKKGKKCYHYRTESNNEEKLEGNYFCESLPCLHVCMEKMRRMEKNFFSKFNLPNHHFPLFPG